MKTYISISTEVADFIVDALSEYGTPLINSPDDEDQELLEQLRTTLRVIQAAR